MGGGSWDYGTYNAVTTASIRSGTNFGYTNATRSQPRSQWKADESLDPLKVNGAGPLAGKNIRESRDSVEHPLSVPIAVMFDVTGSMGMVPRELQKHLAGLFGIVTDRVPDAQVAFGAYGDAEVDAVPLQFGQFESDNRADTTLDKIFIEGNGGGNGHEHSALAWYYAGTHTATDSFEKRGRKGYLFTIGDEISGTIPARAITKYTGDSTETSVTVRDALALAQEKYNVYHIVIDNWSAHDQGSVKFYGDLLGKNMLLVEDISKVAYVIADIITKSEADNPVRSDVNVKVVKREIKGLDQLVNKNKAAIGR